MSQETLQPPKEMARRLSDHVEQIVADSNMARAIAAVREKLLARTSIASELYDEQDIKMIVDNGWWVQRFLIANHKNIEPALNQLDECLKWRKSFGVNTRQLDKHCPKEIHKLGGMFVYEEDINGNPIIYVRIKCNRKHPKLTPIIQQYFISIVEQVESKKKHYLLLLDFTDAGISNINMDMAYFIMSSLQKYYPLGCLNVLCYNSPWIFKGVWGVIKMWLGEKKKVLKFVKGDELFQYADRNKVPKYLGGTCEKSFIQIPENCPSVYEVGPDHGFDKKELDQLLEMFEDLFIETKQLNQLK